MDEPIEVVVEYKGHKIKVYFDDNPSNPREDWDNLSTMVCFHKRYSLGGKEHDWNGKPMELKEWIESNPDEVIAWLPLYLYDHSGITISTSPFSCRWDSGQVGYIFMTREVADKECPPALNDAEIKEWALEVLKQEVKTYDDYITGAVYGYQIEGKLCDDSCWGFYGHDDCAGYMLDEARSQIDYAVDKDEAEIAKKLDEEGVIR